MFCNAYHPVRCACHMCCMRQGRSTKSAYRANRESRKAGKQQSEVTDVKRPMPGQLCGPKEAAFDDQGFKDEFPTLHQYLTCVRWDDGKPRTTTTLLFFVEGEALKCCINDRDNNRSAFVTSAGFAALLSEVETRLREESLDWKTKSQSNYSGRSTPF